MGRDDLFLGVRFTATLERVETPADYYGAVTLRFDNGAKVDIAPEEQVVDAIGESLDFQPGRGLRTKDFCRLICREDFAGLVRLLGDTETIRRASRDQHGGKSVVPSRFIVPWRILIEPD